MANRNYYKTHSHKGFAIFCVVLAFIVAAACTLGGLQLWGKGKQKPSEWFKKEPASAVDNVKYETPLPQNGGMTMPETVEDGEEDETGVKSNGIALMSAAIPVAQYAAYGISPAAETAKTVTATVSPDNEASNTKIKWELAWKNPAAQWATGKEVTDYITLQTNADDLMESKTCTVSCSQAFGEQIQLKAIAVEDETKFATCNIDYVRQIKSVSVNIGTIPVKLGGNTDVSIRIRTDEGGAGGKVTVDQTLGDVYTIDNTYDTQINLNAAQEVCNQTQLDNRKYLMFRYENQLRLGYSALNEVEIDQEIYFDCRLFEQYNFNYFDISDGKKGIDGRDPEWKNLTGNEIKSVIEKLYCQNKVLWTMTVTLTSTEYEYTFTYSSDIVWAAIDESVTLADVSVNDGQDIIFP